MTRQTLANIQSYGDRWFLDTEYIHYICSSYHMGRLPFSNLTTIGRRVLLSRSSQARGRRDLETVFLCYKSVTTLVLSTGVPFGGITFLHRRHQSQIPHSLGYGCLATTISGTNRALSLLEDTKVVITNR